MMRVSSSEKVSIRLLADRPHLMRDVGAIRWREWGHAPEPENLDFWIDATVRESGRDDIPTTWVAIDGRGAAIGAIALGEFDLEERRETSPWVMGMIVHPD
ncbi:MAG: hypothetical protein ACRD1T_10385, partial [Acidimicrobiia bacterium]